MAEAFFGMVLPVEMCIRDRVSTAITALMRGHFLLPVQDDDFFTINLDMYFFSHKRIRYGCLLYTSRCV